jgi:hypothetical protein
MGALEKNALLYKFSSVSARRNIESTLSNIYDIMKEMFLSFLPRMTGLREECPAIEKCYV